MTVAALYVETGGCYFGLPGVDPWDEVRDARSYAGPHPVVAHPPCQRWGRYWGGSPRKPHQYQLGADERLAELRRLALCVKEKADVGLLSMRGPVARDSEVAFGMLALIDELTALRSAPSANNGTTHADGCASWGRQHYDCALAELRRQTERVKELEAALRPFAEKAAYMDASAAPSLMDGFKSRDIMQAARLLQHDSRVPDDQR